MSKNRSIEFLDFIILVVKWKRFLLVLALVTAVISYFLVYFLIKPQYKATATIIPSAENQVGMLGALSEKLSNLPLGLGGSSTNAQMELYTTLIYSRTNIENLIDKYNLIKIYGFENREEAVKATRKMVKSETTPENSFNISVEANTPQMAAEMTNYVVSLLNKSVIQLNVSKAKLNREFLETRYVEIKTNLRNAEDSLRNYQNKTGVFEAEEQSKQTIAAFTKLEGELAAKQIENSVIKQVYGETSSQAQNSQISTQFYQNKVHELEHEGDKSGLFLSLNSLPDKAMNYFRRYRDVEIYTKMLEYIIPVYEQAKFDEQKETPILQVIDYAIPPAKKDYPPRALFTIIITFIIQILTLTYLVVKGILTESSNPKLEFVKKEIFRFKKNP